MMVVLGGELFATDSADQNRAPFLPVVGGRGMRWTGHSSGPGRGIFYHTQPLRRRDLIDRS
jgi:hypothetical protein